MRTHTKEQIAAMSDAERLCLFRAMANDYMKEKKCRWSEACLEIKRCYPEARAVFGAPPLAVEA